MLNLYKLLFEDLNDSCVLYGSWKNNHKLEAALQGIGDLDLLVAKNDRRKFEKIISDYGFVRAENVKLTYPCVEHYFGLDFTTGKACHLHVYYDLVTGTSHGKEYCFNFSKEMLESRFVNSNGIYEIGIEEQACIYVLRHIVKRSSLLGALLYQKERSDYIEEHKYITSRYDKGKAVSHLGCSSDQIFLLSTNFLSDFCSCWLKKRQFRWCIRENCFSLYWNTAKKFAYRVLNKLILKQKKQACGIAVAITGIDGAGKSTLLNNLDLFFKDFLNVETVHFGRPPATIMTFPFRIALKIFRGMKKNSGECSLSAQTIPEKISFFYAVRYLVLAYERATLMRKVQRNALMGKIVLLDRCHSLEVGRMDSPRIANLKDNSFIVSLLAQFESRLYQNMPKADLAVMLTGSLETFILRNQLREKTGKESDEEIQARYDLNRNFVPAAQNVYEVSAEVSAESVCTSVKKIIWAFL